VDSVIAGTAGGTLTTNGTVTLNKANTYDGDTIVSSGTLNIKQAYLHDAASIGIATGAMMILNFEGDDTIASLSLGGAPVGPGTYNATSHPTYFSNAGPGSLVVPGGNYASWAVTHAGGQGPGADFDHDGIPNLIEYALLTNPAGSDGFPGTLNGNTLSFTKRPEAVTNGDLGYAIQTSPDLQDPWTIATPDLDNSTTISLTLPAGQGKLFARLKVVQN
jgi:autotransporter-associated beta strand protein